MLNWVFGNKRKTGKPSRPGKAVEPKPAYETAREIADKGTVEARRELAQHQDLEPEILYYFATDDAPEVRREVAENIGTPLQADLILARDADEEVRAELATKIGRLVPGLSRDENQRLADMALEILSILAQDELPRVRAIISHELKSAVNVPAEIILGLARDLDTIVAVPVLEYSPLLDDADLIGLVTGGLGEDGLSAVARRLDVHEAVVDAIVKSKNIPAVRSVLENSTAIISDQTMGDIEEIAEAVPVLHQPLVNRDHLPFRTVLRIASFVSAALMEVLIERNETRKEVVESLRKTVRDRIDRGKLDEEEPEDEENHPANRARRMLNDGTLDNDALDEALDEHDLAFVRHGLALLAGVNDTTINGILSSGSAKAITALAYKADLKMRVAVRLQTMLGGLRHDKVIAANADGGYPMSQEDLQFYLEGFLAGEGPENPMRGVREVRQSP
ncbi:MAG: DUF2336 domain-containing protein [Proteobacteria bacterium]|nr:DUF2336 domain-containing protein [Pseudomonadota bacterium]